MKLTKKQQRFVDEYMIDLNATRAYKAAGYSVKSDNAAAVEGHKLLRNPKIIKHLKTRMKEREKRTEITQDKVLQELAKIAFDDMKNYLEYKTVKTVVDHNIETGEPIVDYKTVVDLKDSNTIDTRNISEISIGKDGQFKFKLYSKDNALIQLGKHLGLFTEKVDANVDGQLNITIKGV